MGMCTGQCAVVDVNSKCWRNTFCLMCAAYKTDEADIAGVGARRGVGGTSESVGGCWRSLEDVGCRWRMSVRGDIAGPRPEYRSLTGPGYRP